MRVVMHERPFINETFNSFFYQILIRLQHQRVDLDTYDRQNAWHDVEDETGKKTKRQCEWQICHRGIPCQPPDDQCCQDR